jgi:hypothetical protein
MFFKLGNHVHESNPELFAEVEKVESCSAVANIFDTATEPTIALFDPVLEGISADSKCRDLMTADNFITTHGNAYMHICSKKDSGKDLDYLLTGNAKVGYSSSSLYTLLLQNNLNAVKSNATAVPYASINEYTAALEIDEIDFVYSTKYDENMNCVLTTNPNSTDIESVSKYSDDVYATGGMKIVALGVNLDLDKTKEVLNTTLQMDSWKEQFGTYHTEFSLQDRKTQYDLLVTERETYRSQID